MPSANIGVGVMPEYRVILMSDERHRSDDTPSMLLCTDDSDAIESARHLVQGQTVEVWDDGRLVGIVPTQSST